MPIQVTLPDGTQKSYDDGSTPHDVAASIGEGLAKAAIGARVNGELYDVNRPLPGDCELALITAPRLDKKGRSKWRDEQHEKDALYLLRHSTAHVMAEAIERLYPDVQLAYGPPLDNGFYYDMKLDTPIREADFARIEEEMQKIVQANRPFCRINFDKKAGMKRLEQDQKFKGNKYKIDNAGRAIEAGSSELSFYVTGEVLTPPAVESPDGLPTQGERVFNDFIDLCMGPHVDVTSRIGAFKVMTVAASNWKGDVSLDRFQRVYGTAFFSPADLDTYLENLEQAKARDHRVIGRQLGLFEIDEMVGQGLVLWKPKGAVVRDQLQKFISEHLERQGYSQVFTPHIGKLDLYRTSGHFPYYADSQYPPILERDTIRQLADGCSCCAELADKLTFDGADAADVAAEVAGGGYMLKPMNCPHHIRIFASDKHSYRDLPVRLAEFGTVYRWEQSGELGGMTRVRGFTQDDAHVFCTPDQLQDEIRRVLDLNETILGKFGFATYDVMLSTRPEKALVDAVRPALGVQGAGQRGRRSPPDLVGA
ncbi:MAG: threonine--tRNA ligase, partial [Planctomycetota bacterium]